VTEWLDHAEWWLGEVAADPIYRLDVVPLAVDLLSPVAGPLLDLGCGEGQMMRALDRSVVGCDIVPRLLQQAREAGPVVCCRLPSLGWAGDGVFGAAYMVLVLEHLPQLDIFAEAARIVKPNGALVVVMNHPAFTPESAGPIVDPTDGEFLWRWGRYFVPAEIGMAAGRRTVSFYHRPLGSILDAAAAAGWMLDRFVEVGFSDAAIAAVPAYRGQEQMPRLLGARWTNTQGSQGFRR
jgi:SAM-dependent methyltransferase